MKAARKHRPRAAAGRKPAAARCWLDAAAESAPELKLRGLLELRRRLSALCPEGRWEGAVGSAGGLARLGARFTGPEDRFAAWLPEAAALLDLRLPEAAAAPAAGVPWLSLIWDGERGAVESCSLAGRAAESGRAGSSGSWSFEAGGAAERVLSSRTAFEPALIRGLPVEDAFSKLAGLWPLRWLVSESSVDAAGRLTPRLAWSLVGREPLPWPLLLRLDLAAPFAAASSALSFVALDRPVAEIAFRKESLWAYFKG